MFSRAGRFDKEENAARAHDLVSLKFWGDAAQTNFPVCCDNYFYVVISTKHILE